MFLYIRVRVVLHVFVLKKIHIFNGRKSMWGCVVNVEECAKRKKVFKDFPFDHTTETLSGGIGLIQNNGKSPVCYFSVS